MKNVILIFLIIFVFVTGAYGNAFYVSASLGYAEKGMSIIDVTLDNDTFGIFVNGASNINNYASDDGFVEYHGVISAEQLIETHHYKFAASFGIERNVYRSLWLRAGLSVSKETYFDEFVNDDYDTRYREKKEAEYEYGPCLGASVLIKNIVVAYQYTEITGHVLMVGYRLHL